MSLGILNNLSAVYAENNLNKTNSSLNTVLQQLSSGSKINSGADDAAGLSLVDGLQANQQALTQSQTNATEGVGLLQVADGALSQVTSLLNRAVTLATEAANGTLNSSQDTAANQEYQSILSEISNIGSTTTYNQNQVFNSNTGIYTGDSTQSGASIDQLNIRSLSSSNVGDTGGTMAYNTGQTGSNVFINLSNDGTKASLNDSLGTSAQTTAIQVTYLTNGAAGAPTSNTATITVGSGTQYANTVGGLINAINGAGLGLTATLGTAQQAGAAAVQNALSAGLGGGSSQDMGIEIQGNLVGVEGGAGSAAAGTVGQLTVSAVADTLGGTLTIVDSNGKSHQVTLGTSGSTDTLANLTNTINAAGYGVTATYNAASKALTFSSQSSNVTVSGQNLTDAGTSKPSMLAETPTTGGAQFADQVGKIVIGGASSAASDVLSGTLTIGSQSITLNSSDDTLQSLAATINAANYGVTATFNQSQSSLVLTSTNSALGTASGTGIFSTSGLTDTTDTTDGTVTITNPNITSQAYYSTGIASSGGIKDYTTTVQVSGSATYGGTGNTGIVADLSGTSGTATMSYTDKSGQSLSSTDLSSQADAQSALTSLNAAIADVAAQDGYIGAQINTLNSVSSVLATQQENVQSAQNAVQATDYAQASSNMSKYEILSQTGIAALAQANSLQQEVTKLLQ